MAEIDNCDGFNYWYRRVPCHPDLNIATAAASFKDAVAEDLGLRAPFPSIVWYAPENRHAALKEWLDAYHQAPHLKWGWEENPFTLPCETFKFPKEQAGRTVHRGYTHRDGPRLIGVLCNLPQDDTLSAIAHECVHLQQDDNRPGWWMDNMREADALAEAYAKAGKDKFPQFFQQTASTHTPAAETK